MKLSKREEYFSLIKKHDLSNALDLIDIGYSKKVALIKKLLEKYTPSEIKYSLNVYRTYIAIEKYNIPYLYNTLSGTINRLKERELNESLLQKM